MVRSMLDQVNRRRRSSPFAAPQAQDVSVSNDSSSVVSASTQPSEVSDEDGCRQTRTSDSEMLQRAHDLHSRIDFDALAAGPGKGGPWRRVEAAGRFVVFRCQETKASGRDKGPEVLCAGRLDASIEEVANVLRTATEAAHNAVMTGLHGKKFIFGSLERTVPTGSLLDNGGNDEHLTVKTCSFSRTAMFDSNEQWCYLDFFQKKSTRDGFTIAQASLERFEPTPGRITGPQSRVNQLHDLTAAYLVDLDPGNNGLRVVFKAQFGTSESSSRDRSASNETTSSTKASSPTDRNNELKMQSRRLLSLAQGVTKLPELVRRRRFGFQLPANLDALNVSNQRCPCCTRSLAPMKMSLRGAASAISNRSLSPLRTDTRRCYLCGYLVCIDCWSADRMENAAGRVAGIIVCRRCRASVDACDYSSIAADPRGPVRVVPDPQDASTASLLVDYLAASLDEAPPGSAERSHVLKVVRTMLHQQDREDLNALCVDQLEEMDAMARVEDFLADERNFPVLESCALGNVESRDYPIDWREDKQDLLPRGPIPSNEGRRLSAAQGAGLLALADQLAPSNPDSRDLGVEVNTHDLELICHMAAKAMGSESLISVMGAEHEHVLAASSPHFAGAAVPREHTLCQHQLMSSDPIMLVHPEADARLHAIHSVKEMGLKTYVGFPITAPTANSDEQIAVGTLCCYSTEARAELTHSQYAMLDNLARTASQVLQQKGSQLKQRAAPA